MIYDKSDIILDRVFHFHMLSEIRSATYLICGHEMDRVLTYSGSTSSVAKGKITKNRLKQDFCFHPPEIE